LASRDWERAATKFAAVATHTLNSSTTTTTTTNSNSHNHTNNNAVVVVDWPTVLAPEDVALYTALLALAVLPREEMMALAEHAEALEFLQPPALRDCLVLFGSARPHSYRQCWTVLQEAVFGQTNNSILTTTKMMGKTTGPTTPTMVLSNPGPAALDLYLASHLSTLQQLMLQKSVLQYWQAYQRVPLDSMTHELGWTDDHHDNETNSNNNNSSNNNNNQQQKNSMLEQLLTELIRNGQLTDTRLDLQSQTLVRNDQEGKDDDDNDALQRRLSVVTANVLDDTYSLLIRMACVEHDLVVVDPSKARSSQQRGGSGGGHHQGGFGRTASTSGGGRSAPGGYEIEESSEEEMMMDTPMMDVADGMNPEDLY